MDLHGLLLVDKPSGLTSHDVVARLRRALRQKRIGHTGTLDPIATGLLIMVLGEATKLSDYLLNEDKAYSVRVRLGQRTDTLDRSGTVLETRPVHVSDEYLRSCVSELEGEFDWPVPAFSAVKVDGQKLYEKARRNLPVEAPVKTMAFWGIEVRAVDGPLVDLDMNCSKGSFIRTWVDKLGEKLGTGAVVEELRRTRIGPWRLTQAITLPQLEQRAAAGLNPEGLEHSFISLSQALPSLRSVTMDDREARLMGNGQIPRSVEGRLIPEQKQAFERNEPIYVKVVSNAGELLALLGAEPGQGLKIRRVFRI